MPNHTPRANQSSPAAPPRASSSGVLHNGHGEMLVAVELDTPLPALAPTDSDLAGRRVIAVSCAADAALTLHTVAGPIALHPCTRRDADLLRRAGICQVLLVAGAEECLEDGVRVDAGAG